MSAVRRIALAAILAAALLAGTAAVGTAAAAVDQPEGPAQAQGWVDTTLRGMSLEEKVGQMFVNYVYGPTADTADARKSDRLRHRLRRHPGRERGRPRRPGTGRRVRSPAGGHAARARP